MKNKVRKEKILNKINELNSIYSEMNVILAKCRGKQQLADNRFFELIELIEEPICQKLYLGDYGLYVAWGRDEVNVPRFLVFEDNQHFPVNNLHVTPDIYGISEISADAILEYKMCYLEEKFNFLKEY